MNTEKVDKSIILVTGVSGAIGTAICLKLLSNSNVIGVSRSEPSELLQRLKNFEWMPIDLMSPDAELKIHRSLEQRDIKLSGLVNNAATNLHEIGHQGELDSIRYLINLNLMVPVTLTHTLSNVMLDNSSIVNITSIASSLGFPGNPGYHAAKAGLAGVTRSQAYDLAGRGIRVNSVAPGYVHTKMTENSYSDPELNLKRTQRTLLNRWGNPDEVANLVDFLMSNKASYITGQEIFVDGGWSIKGI